jgi:hypothetical protein
LYASQQNLWFASRQFLDYYDKKSLAKPNSQSKHFVINRWVMERRLGHGGGWLMEEAG